MCPVYGRGWWMGGGPGDAGDHRGGKRGSSSSSSQSWAQGHTLPSLLIVSCARICLPPVWSDTPLPALGPRIEAACCFPSHGYRRGQSTHLGSPSIHSTFRVCLSVCLSFPASALPQSRCKARLPFHLPTLGCWQSVKAGKSRTKARPGYQGRRGRLAVATPPTATLGCLTDPPTHEASIRSEGRSALTKSLGDHRREGESEEGKVCRMGEDWLGL
ncbi:hypothetical protein BCV69DRAFT_79180 [Microstroma glucosiphilum]|uniref:Uncharacterized protein n=1 Tax=Pseudomicrostroma glucosiphilum TaxID=1684307 RepID=A0A316TYB2_9BASI|nr:hypothetical protein BCV69DRAFT_79180 [Pseudomicrostroma glucosiphilum]PWN18232.1 hypothetical protein BCV69DRAFT_79180 [Pseudomicrostroma glucosiphilum]